MEIKTVAKTKLLSAAETARIRALVVKRYMGNDATRASFHPNTFLGTYEGLREDIIRVVPEAESSVSATRLRKLFYYSNPELCPPDQLDKGAFGKDFLEALEKYIPQTKGLPFKASLKNWSVYIGGILMLCLFGLIWNLFCSNSPKVEEYFDDTSIQGIRKRGWEIADFDSSLWFPQNRPGFLTLRTSRGDYWFTPPDTPIIHNLLFKKIPDCSCFKLTFKIVDFRPSENYQQVGVVFLNNRRERDHNIRVTIAVGGGIQKLQVIKREHGQAYEQSQDCRTIGIDPPIDSVWISVVKRDDEFEFFYNTRNQYGPFMPFAKMDFDFEPVYIGIGAFNGIRQYDFGPLNSSSSIPAYIDYLIFKPCEK